MPISLLQTKLFAPLVPPELVSRPRLIERFEAGLHRKLTLVSAPAGFGKTTLLTEWVHQHREDSQVQMPVGWISLDKDDNDPSRYWTYYVEALQMIHPDMGRSVIDMIQSPQPQPVESFLTSLINELNIRTEPFVLILDDYHMIENETIHHAMTFLLEHMPPQMHLVISSRVDPPLPLALLRGRGQLNQFSATDLRFTFGETEAFFNEVMKLGLSKLGVKVLENRTEGWVASLQMAAISMRGHNDIQKFIYSFSGSQRYVLDYLTEEVFTQQPADVQSFLLETSILDRLTAPLSNAVTKRNDAMEKLDYLEAANLFLVPLDDERKWFRYHTLFADLLRSQLTRTLPDLPPLLHQRASQWFEQEGLTAEAIDHALAAGDFEKAANLIEAIAVTMITVESKVSTLLRWIAKLPDELINKRPWLCIALAGARMAAGRLDDVEPLLRSVEAMLSTTAENNSETVADHTKIRSVVLALRASASAQGDIDIQRNLEPLREAFEQLPDDETFARAPIALNLGVAYAMRGEMNTANRFLNEALTLGKATGNPYIALIAMGCMAEIQTKMGFLHQAAETNRHAIRLGLEWSDGEDPLSATSYAHISLAQILYQWNELDEASQHFTRGIQLSEQCGTALIVQFFYPGLALMEEFQSKTNSTSELHDLAKRIAYTPHNTLLSRLMDAWQARLSLAHGDLEATQRWAACHEIELSVQNFPDLWQEFSYLTLVRLYIARGKAEEIDELLERMRQKAESEGRTGSVIEILVLQSIALKTQGKINQSLKTLEHVLSLSQQEGYIRVFLDEGYPMKELLHHAASRGITPVYVNTLLDAFKGSVLTYPDKPVGEVNVSTETTTHNSLASKLSGILSVREREVLRLMASGASSKEVAGELFISVGTAKKHIKNIYRKLDVHKQTTAVTRAQELGLI
ncbi:MAG: hypothetical protein HQ553_18375 [Chloroflexi bacterium]|nr:hypothetical protein [Chloroflexota bacterium]